MPTNQYHAGLALDQRRTLGQAAAFQRILSVGFKQRSATTLLAGHPSAYRKMQIRKSSCRACWKTFPAALSRSLAPVMAAWQIFCAAFLLPTGEYRRGFIISMSSHAGSITARQVNECSERKSHDHSSSFRHHRLLLNATAVSIRCASTPFRGCSPAYCGDQWRLSPTMSVAAGVLQEEEEGKPSSGTSSGWAYCIRWQPLCRTTRK